LYQEYVIRIQSKLGQAGTTCLESIQLQIQLINTFDKRSIKTIGDIIVENSVWQQKRKDSSMNCLFKIKISLIRFV